MQSWRNTQHTYFLVTQSGYVGKGSMRTDTQAGDHIFVAAGGLFPLVLRPTGEKSTYKYVGNCYVHGITHGEAVNGNLRSPDRDFEDIFLE